MQVLSEMVNNNLQPTYQMYARLASLCAAIGDFTQANAILQAMQANGLVPGIFILFIMICFIICLFYHFVC